MGFKQKYLLLHSLSKIVLSWEYFYAHLLQCSLNNE